MFFPIGDINIKSGAKPVFTWLFLAANIAVFIYQLILPQPESAQLMYDYACIPVEITRGKDLYTLLSCTFLHSGWLHIIFNMLFMWIFADNIEATIGNFKFLLFYLAGGLVASLSHCLLNINSAIPCVGASGAIAACLGAYLVMYPFSKIKIFVVFIFSSIQIPAFLFLGFWIAKDILSGVHVLGTAASGTAYWAHIGGFIFGAVCGLRFRDKAKTMEFHT